MRRDLTIATSCFNEADSLPSYFSRIDFVRRSLVEAGWNVKLLLIDDGSRDRTLELLADYARSRPDAEVLRHPRNLGYGAAIKTALAIAESTWVVFVDADSNYDQAIILELAKLVDENTQLINVSIFAPGGAMAYPWYRMMLSKTATLIYKIALPRLTRGVYTMTCGFRWYRRDAALEIFPHIDDFAATAEIMLRALQRGIRVIEVPARNSRREHGFSKMKFLSVSLRHFRLALAALAGRLGEPLSLEEHRRRIGREG